MKRLAVLLAAALAGCADYALVPPGRTIAVADSRLVVTPPDAWNRLGGIGPGKHAELWTLDGPQLNELTFYGGIPDGRTLFREVDRREAPLPRFAATMLPTDIPALLEASYRVAAGTALFTLDRVEPATFAGHPGVRFAYHYTLPDEDVRRDGEGTGAIIAGHLYLVTFEAPAIHYFARDVGRYRAVVASARLE